MTVQENPKHKFKIGDEVILGEHQDDGTGNKNWAPNMSQYVGKKDRIKSCSVVDPTAPTGPTPTYTVEGNTWVWRECNMTPVSGTVAISTECGCFCSRCGDYNAYIPSDTKAFKCFGCRN